MINRTACIQQILNALAYVSRSDALVALTDYFDDSALNAIAMTIGDRPHIAKDPPTDDAALQLLFRLHNLKQKFGVSYEVINFPTTSPFARDATLAERWVFSVNEALG